jgi:hypothetical protein
MYRFALLVAALLTTGCDSDGASDDQPPPSENVDDGSVDLADRYVAELADVNATFFRVSEGGVCATTVITLRFDRNEFDLVCRVLVEGGEDEVYNPDGSFTYVLEERQLAVTPSFGYRLTGTAFDNGDRIEAQIQRGNARSIDATLIAQR